ncbi:hypothetical protein [Xanthovirga aplysinae]|uniref:hypothetical protein n=1 Tax=Xanthovirga aplysinae TaxID=2529853 RepID=UPI0012BD5C0B|nr:hypothetical protein [Xanthovirga aplysinae]MTI31695.1 hypothetical protein [Xanthovirga aplysinae]
MQQPSNQAFFTLWIGNNDVLNYAFADKEAPTSVDEFSSYIEGVIGGLKAANPEVQGALLNVPDITSIPYFDYVGWNGLVIDGATADVLNATYKGNIEPGILEAVKLGVITEGVRIKVVAGIALELVKAQLMDPNGPNMSEEQALAYLDTAEGQAQVDALIDSYENRTLPEDDLAAYDAAVAVEMENQQPIIVATLDGYNNGLLPEEDMLMLQAAIEEQFNITIEGLKAAGIYPTFQEGPNPFVVAVDVTEENPLGIRQAVEGELIALSILSLPDQPLEENGPSKVTALADEFVLELEEIQTIQNAVKDYNASLKNIAAANGFAYVDMKSLIEQYQKGYSVDGVRFSSEFVTGGIFGLDGIHLTQPAAAIVANEIIRTVNEHYDSSISPVNVNEFEGIEMPNTVVN